MSSSIPVPTLSPTAAAVGEEEEEGGGSDDERSTPEASGSPRRELSPAGCDTGGGGGGGFSPDFDVETLDESEFDLPPVATPTLQSILDEMQNEDEDDFEIGKSPTWQNGPKILKERKKIPSNTPITTM